MPVLLVAALAVAGASCGGSVRDARGKQRSAPASVGWFRQALVRRLQSKRLTFRWVACVRNGRRFRGQPIVRCNVDFGDPHIEAYCSVRLGGRLVTNHDDPALPCQRDEAGAPDTVVSS